MDISNIEIAEEFYRIINDDSYFNAKYKSQEARYSVGFSKDTIKSLINSSNKHDAVNEILQILKNPENILNLTNKDDIRIYNGSIELLKKLLILTKLHHLYNAYKSGKLTSYHHDESLISRFIEEDNIQDEKEFLMRFYTYYQIIQRENINNTNINVFKSDFEENQKRLVKLILNNENIAKIILSEQSSIQQAFAGGFNNRKTKRVLKRY